MSVAKSKLIDANVQIAGDVSLDIPLPIAQLAITGTPDGTQFLRDDGAWASPSGGSGGVPAGGTTGQLLAKIDGTDYNTDWVDPPTGGAGSGGGFGIGTPPAYSGSFASDSDDFTGASLGAAWSTLNLGAGGAAVSVGGDVVRLYRPASDHADKWRGITRAIPSSGAFTYDARIKLNSFFAGSGGVYAALAFRQAGGSAPNASNTSSDYMVGVVIARNGASGTQGVAAFQSASSSTAITMTTSFLTYYGLRDGWLRLAFDGSTTTTVSFSDDGVLWYPITTFSLFYLNGVKPDSLALLLNSVDSTNDSAADIEYCWRTA